MKATIAADDNHDEFTTAPVRFSITNANLVFADNAANSSVIDSHNGETIVATLSGRTLYTNEQWNTLCLPFDVTSLEGSPLQGATVKTLESTSFADGKLTINFSDNVSTLEAGKPYIVKWETSQENITDPVFNAVTINTTLAPVATTTTGASGGTKITFAGAYSPMFIGMVRKNLLYFGANNTIYYPDGVMTIGSCRGHFRLQGIEAGDLPSNAIELNFNDETTGLSPVHSLNSEGSSYWYTLDGRKLSGKPTQKGIYINNGKKIIVTKK